MPSIWNPQGSVRSLFSAQNFLHDVGIMEHMEPGSNYGPTAMWTMAMLEKSHSIPSLIIINQH